MSLTSEQKTKWVKMVCDGFASHEFLRLTYVPSRKDWKREFLRDKNFDPPLSDAVLDQLYDDTSRTSVKFALAGENVNFQEIAEREIDWKEVEASEFYEKTRTPRVKKGIEQPNNHTFPPDNVGTRLAAQVKPDDVVRTPDGAIDIIQTALNKMREVNGARSKSGSSLVEMTKWLNENKIDSPKWSFWQQFKYDCKERYWWFLDLFTNWSRTLRNIKNIAFGLAIILGFILAIFIVSHSIRHMVYPRWIEPEENADSIVYYRTHWISGDDVIVLSAKVDPENTNGGVIWMEKSGTNWFPFFNFDE